MQQKIEYFQTNKVLFHDPPTDYIDVEFTKKLNAAAAKGWFIHHTFSIEQFVFIVFRKSG